jgi:alpha-N-arabinofuranosidase
LSLARLKSLVITVVNPSISESRETQLVLHAAKIKSATATVLTHSDIHAHNTFAQKQTVVPQTKNIAAPQADLTYTFAPASVTKLTLDLV